MGLMMVASASGLTKRVARPGGAYRKQPKRPIKLAAHDLESLGSSYRNRGTCKWVCGWSYPRAPSGELRKTALHRTRRMGIPSQAKRSQQAVSKTSAWFYFCVLSRYIQLTRSAHTAQHSAASDQDPRLRTPCHAIPGQQGSPHPKHREMSVADAHQLATRSAKLFALA